VAEADVVGNGHEAAHDAHHGFDMGQSLVHHNMPYPAVEWLHNKPLLIFNEQSFRELKGAQYSQQQVDNMVAHAMVLPEPLGFFNTQTFFGTIALILMVLFVGVIGRRRSEQMVPKGRIQGAIEALVLFIRNDVVRPNIHHGDAWTAHVVALFLAILSFNLMGLIPGTGTASSNILVTAGFAITTLATMLFFGMKQQGVLTFWQTLVPVPFSLKPIGLFVWTLLAIIELLSLLTKPIALAIRLFANMFAGHTVLLAFTSLGFILYSVNAGGVLEVSLGLSGFVLAVAIYFLELLVAFVQAYVFTLLSAVFIGASIHPEH
jgi:F-type H+-transporting ATPase subunit a